MYSILSELQKNNNFKNSLNLNKTKVQLIIYENEIITLKIFCCFIKKFTLTIQSKKKNELKLKRFNCD